MANYEAQVLWERGDQAFVDQRYSRRHWLRFDGGLEVPGSSSPHVVPLPWSDPAAVDPEEAFIASMASCHMLWFLSLAAREGYCVDRYDDRASGTLAPAGALQRPPAPHHRGHPHPAPPRTRGMLHRQLRALRGALRAGDRRRCLSPDQAIGFVRSTRR